MTLQVSIDSEKYLQKCKRNEELRKKRKEQQNVKTVNDLNSITRTRGNVDVDVDVDDDVSKKEEKKKAKKKKFRIS